MCRFENATKNNFFNKFDAQGATVCWTWTNVQTCATEYFTVWLRLKIICHWNEIYMNKMTRHHFREILSLKKFN